MLSNKNFLNFYDSVFKYFTTFLPNSNLTAIFIKQLTFTESFHSTWFTFHRKITLTLLLQFIYLHSILTKFQDHNECNGQ